MWFTNYICNGCGAVFREDEIKDVYTMEGEGCMRGPLFDHDECPFCGCEDIVKAVECPACGEYYNGEEDYCENCQKAIHEQNDEFINSVQNYFDIDYEEALKLIIFDLERRA